MRKILLTTTAALAFGLGSAIAQESPVDTPNARDDIAQDPTVSATQDDDQAAGAAAGGVTGAIAGAVVGGPVGAVIGGFAGATLGSAASVPDPAVQYVVSNPVEPVAIDTDVTVGATVPADVELRPIPDHPEYAYIYTNDRPLVVRQDTREIVYSPGYVLPQQTVTYVESNPVDPITIEGDVTVGATVPAEVELRPIPDNPRFSYVYVDDRPAIVDPESRTVVWVR
jgi:hypothetical protein